MHVATKPPLVRAQDRKLIYSQAPAVWRSPSEHTLARPRPRPTSRQRKPQSFLPCVCFTSHIQRSLLTLLVTRCMQDFPPASNSLQYQLNWTQFWHHTLLEMPIPRPGCHLCFWLMGSKSKVPITPSSGSINLLEQLTNLRKALNVYQFIKAHGWTTRWANT